MCFSKYFIATTLYIRKVHSTQCNFVFNLYIFTHKEQYGCSIDR